MATWQEGQTCIYRCLLDSWTERQTVLRSHYNLTYIRSTAGAWTGIDVTLRMERICCARRTDMYRIGYERTVYSVGTV